MPRYYLLYYIMTSQKHINININSKTLYRKINKYYQKSKKLIGGSEVYTKDKFRGMIEKNLFYWAKKNDINKVKEAITKLKDNNYIDNRNINGDTALIIASRAEKLEIVDLLIKNKANINLKTNNGNTALMIASNSGNLDIVDLLIKNKANINLKNNNNDNALILASRSMTSNTNIVELLINAGSELNIRGYKGATALIEATKNEYIKIVKLLIDARCNIDIKTNNGRTALMIALRKNESMYPNVKIYHWTLDQIQKRERAINNYKIIKLLVDISFVFLNGDSFPIQDLDIKLNKNKIPINEIYTAIFKSDNRIIKKLTNIPFEILDNGRAVKDIDIRKSKMYSILYNYNVYKEIQIDKDIYYYCNNSSCDKRDLDLFKKNYENNTYKYFGKLKEIIKDISCKKLNNCESCTRNIKCKYKKYSKEKSRKKKGKEGKCVGKNHKAKLETDYIKDYKRCTERGVQTYETEV